MLNDGEKLDYGFGIRDTEYQGLRMVAHSGAMMGFRADFIRFPEQRLSVACLCNLGSISRRRSSRGKSRVSTSRKTLRKARAVRRQVLKRRPDGHRQHRRPRRKSASRTSGVPDGRIVFVEKDSFRIYRNSAVEFVQDAKGISGFTVNMGRAKGLPIPASPRADVHPGDDWQYRLFSRNVVPQRSLGPSATATLSASAITNRSCSLRPTK